MSRLSLLFWAWRHNLRPAVLKETFGSAIRDILEFVREILETVWNLWVVVVSPLVLLLYFVILLYHFFVTTLAKPVWFVINDPEFVQEFRQKRERGES